MTDNNTTKRAKGFLESFHERYEIDWEAVGPLIMWLLFVGVFFFIGLLFEFSESYSEGKKLERDLKIMEACTELWKVHPQKECALQK